MNEELTQGTLEKLADTVRRKADKWGLNTEGLKLNLYLPLPVSSELNVKQGQIVNGATCTIYKEHGDIICSYDEIIRGKDNKDRTGTPNEFLTHRGLTPLNVI